MVSDLWRSIDWSARRAIAWPLILVGAALVAFGGGCILLGAWIADVPTDEDA